MGNFFGKKKRGFDPSHVNISVPKAGQRYELFVLESNGHA
jgi:hypothetical protein